MALKDLTGIYADIYKHQKDNALKDGIAELQTKVTALAALANDLKAKYNAAVTLINELKADMSAHTHGGVTAGEANTAAAATISATNSSVSSVADVTI
jgi:predicted  nucleic acid-binding Zn-ribbon protein